MTFNKAAAAEMRSQRIIHVPYSYKMADKIIKEHLLQSGITAKCISFLKAECLVKFVHVTTKL